MTTAVFRAFSRALILALLFAAVLPISAFADEGTPPTEPAPTEESVGEEEQGSGGAGDVEAPETASDGGVEALAGAETEEPLPEVLPTEAEVLPEVTETSGPEVAPSVEETVLTEAVILPEVAETPVPEDAPIVDEAAPTESVEETTPATEEVAPLLSELPTDTEVLVLSEEGEALPLASEEAAAVVAGSDPIWCPASVAMPVDDGSGCSPRFDSFNALLTWLGVNDPGVAGTIWIEKGYDSGSVVGDAGDTQFNLNSGVFPNMVNFPLTIKGGWNGIGTNTIDINDRSEFNGSLNIMWNAEVTLNDLLITGTSEGTGLYVHTTKKITILRVDASGNTGNGAKLSNGAGTGDVLITSSTFSSNNYPGPFIDATGLEVNSHGVITLSSVIASDNERYGAELTNSLGILTKNVTLATGTFQFNNNGSAGLVIYSRGLISLKDIDAIGNGADGIYIDNTSSTLAQGVTLTGTNVVGENGEDGLDILSEGPINLNNLISNSNGDWGVELDNTFATSAQPVSVSGSSEFKFNDGGGLSVNSNGIITINNVSATDNGTGVYLDNDGFDFSSDVNVTGSNLFDRNGYNGLVVWSKGAIKVSNISASGNGLVDEGDGAYLNNTGATTPKPVTLTGVNWFGSNEWSGLRIFSDGVISLANVTASNNLGGDGIFVDNAADPTKPQAVILSGTTKAKSNFDDGLDINTYGAVTIAGIIATDNGDFGAYITKYGGSSAAFLTITGTSTFTDNLGTGLYAEGLGPISLNNITADFNHEFGAQLLNTTSGNVTITGTNSFSNNWGDAGLSIESAGSIKLYNFDAMYNLAGYGLNFNNAYGTGNVTIITSLANWCNGIDGNGLSGVEIWSLGTVAVSNLCGGDGNGLDGVRINNRFAATPKSVTVSGIYNNFENNARDGLVIYSKGPVTLSNIVANDNVGYGDGLTGYGVYVDNSFGGTAQPVTLNGVNQFNNNGLDGVHIYSLGAIKLNQTTATGNGDEGASLENRYSSTPQTVMLTGTNTFNENWGEGLYIKSKGAVTISNITASYNGSNTLPLDYWDGYGAFIQNTYSYLTPQNVTITGYGIFEGNVYSGLEIYSWGNISVANLHAEGNGFGELDDADKYGMGAVLYNTTCDPGWLPRPITMTGTNVLSNNWSGGLDIQTLGNVSINNLDASGNGGTGARLEVNCGNHEAIGTVTITGHTWVSDNGMKGIDVSALRAISVTNLVANNNGSYGAMIHNDTGVGGITYSGTVYTSNNGGFGLTSWSNGAINFNLTDAAISGNGTSLPEYGSWGWSLDNTMATTPMPVNLIVPSGKDFDFTGNETFGLQIISNGSVKVTNLDARDNVSYGASLTSYYTVGSVTVTTPVGRNSFTSNGGIGLSIVANGAVILDDLLAEYNGEQGVVIDNNEAGPATPKAVIISGSNEFFYNDLAGLEVYSHGAITLNNINASWNGQLNNPSTREGAFLDNQTDTTTPKGITLNGTNIFEGNLGEGLVAWSKGLIKANSVTSNENVLIGADLYNRVAGAVGGVMLTGVNTFNDSVNSGGLSIRSYGAVTLSNVSASGNALDGVDVQNESLTTVAVPVTISGTNTFSSNGNVGLAIWSDSQINLNNITADWNMGHGVMLDNHDKWFTTPVSAIPGVTITGKNNFRGNEGSGLQFESLGLVSLAKVTADNNSGAGVSGITDGNITWTCGSLTSNTTGWSLGSGGTITLKAVWAFGNGFINEDPLGGSLIRVRTC